MVVLCGDGLASAPPGPPLTHSYLGPCGQSSVPHFRALAVSLWARDLSQVEHSQGAVTGWVRSCESLQRRPSRCPAQQVPGSLIVRWHCFPPVPAAGLEGEDPELGGDALGQSTLSSCVVGSRGAPWAGGSASCLLWGQTEGTAVYPNNSLDFPTHLRTQREKCPRRKEAVLLVCGHIIRPSPPLQD